MKEKAIVSWSGGKDCALALFETQKDWDIIALLTTVTDCYDRTSMHGVRTSLMKQQAQSLGYALDIVTISAACSNAEYETKVGAALDRYRGIGVTAVVCGDIFLEDVRRYREEKLFTAGLKGVFPLWKRETTELASQFITLGFQCVLCCVNGNAVDQGFAGRLYNHDLLAKLPPGVDPCGENGEFHSFVFNGPNFARPIEYQIGDRTLRHDGFCFCDLLPAAHGQA